VIIENITAGYLARYTTDIVAVNSRSDFATFQSIARNLELPTDNLLLCGLPLRSGIQRDMPVDTPVKTVMFADQPTVPQTRVAYAQAHNYARSGPGAKPYAKPRCEAVANDNRVIHPHLGKTLWILL
jgi:hypothetical protein